MAVLQFPLAAVGFLMISVFPTFFSSFFFALPFLISYFGLWKSMGQVPRFMYLKGKIIPLLEKTIDSVSLKFIEMFASILWHFSVKILSVLAQISLLMY